MLRAFHGLAYYLSRLEAPIFWNRAFEPHVNALSAEIDAMPLPPASESKCDFGSLARYLKIRVSQNGRTKVELTQYAAGIDNLNDLLDNDIKQRIARQGVNLQQIVSRVRSQGYQPASVFELNEDGKHIQVWLE